MALYRYVAREGVGEDGCEYLWITDELEETPCARCGDEAHPQVCSGDGRYHHHGCVHTPTGGLEPLCTPCAGAVADEWENRKRMAQEVRATIDAL